MNTLQRLPQTSATNGTPGRIRTCYPRLRRPMLYPNELRAHSLKSLPTNGRGRGIRTPDILHPKQARYQTALFPEFASRATCLQGARIILICAQTVNSISRVFFCRLPSLGQGPRLFEIADPTTCGRPVALDIAVANPSLSSMSRNPKPDITGLTIVVLCFFFRHHPSPLGFLARSCENGALAANRAAIP